MRDGPAEEVRDAGGVHLPVGEEVAAEVMRGLKEMSVAEIAESLKVSAAMASRITAMAYDFPHKANAMKALEAFTGVVFKALDYPTLSAQAKEYVERNVRIVSSLYGWLTPLDSVKPYRLEFNAQLAPGEVSFSRYWRKDVTINLVRTLQESGATDIIDLMPGDAAKCIDTKLVKRFAKIWKVDFKQLLPGGGFRTPPAGRLKQLRGELLREMAQRDITSPQELMTLATPTLLPMGTPDYPDHIAFCVD